MVTLASGVTIDWLSWLPWLALLPLIVWLPWLPWPAVLPLIVWLPWLSWLAVLPVSGYHVYLCYKSYKCPLLASAFRYGQSNCPEVFRSPDVSCRVVPFSTQQ